MSLPVKKIELVSPAGGWDQLIAAINAGADAVYLGYSKFSARAYAENFDFALLKKAVKTAHDFNVKVYLALNTLLRDCELEEISFFLNEYLSFCQDGIIIQDTGLYKTIRDLFGKTRVHASTQLNIHNSRSLEFLHNQGFARVVLAREMTLEEIKNIYKSCSIANKLLEIEIFGHGSQCYSYSGNCFFSSFTGIRSGNRGRCTQPCRMKYSLKTENGSTLISDAYILSKTDLLALPIIPQIISAGVDAIKIEGRAKSAEYVAIITSLYRKYIDLYYSDPRKYQISNEDIYKGSQIFSRESGTGYYLEQFPRDIVSLKKSGSVGNFLGRVIKAGRKYLVLKSDLQIVRGDIIEIWTNRGNERLTVKNCRLNEEKEKKISSGHADKLNKKKLLSIETDKDFRSSAGDRVFKFYDINLDREAKSFYTYGLKYKKNKYDKELQYTPTSYKKSAVKNIEKYFENKCLGKRIRSSDGSSTLKILQNGVEPGISLELYSIEDVYALLKINSLKLVKNIIINSFDEVFTDSHWQPGMIDKLNNALYQKDINVVIKTPAIIYDKSLKVFEKSLNNIFDTGLNNFTVSNLGILESICSFFGKNHASNERFIGNDEKLNIYLDHSLNIFNEKTVEFFIDTVKNNPYLKIKNIALSAELSLEEIGEIINKWYAKKDPAKTLKPDDVITDDNENIGFSAYSYGYYPVMASRFKMQYLDSRYVKKAENKNKKQYYLTDKKGYGFRIISDYNDNIVFLNSKKICNLFNITDFLNAGIHCFHIDSRTFDSGEIGKIVEFYSRAIKAAYDGKTGELERMYKSASKTELFSDFTRGHFYRKVM